jgi:hypothetical protein
MTPSEQIDQMIAGLSDWRGPVLEQVRQIILAADPDIVEEWKWMGSPVWVCHGNIAVGNPHKDKVKLTFSHGASLPDLSGLFNNGLNGKVWRAIDIAQGDRVDAAALTALIRAAIAFNREKANTKAPAGKRPAGSAPS